MHPIRMAKNPEHWQQQMSRRMYNRNYHLLLVGMQTTQPLWNRVCQFLRTLNITASLAVALLGIYPNEKKSYVYTKIHTKVQNSIIYKFLKTGSNQDVFHQWYIQIVESFSVVKRNELQPRKRHEGKFECILLIEKKPVLKHYILHGSNYMICWKM